MTVAMHCNLKLAQLLVLARRSGLFLAKFVRCMDRNCHSELTVRILTSDIIDSVTPIF